MNRTTKLAMSVMAALGLLLAACGEGTTETGQLSSDSLGSSVDGTDGDAASSDTADADDDQDGSSDGSASDGGDDQDGSSDDDGADDQGGSSDDDGTDTDDSTDGSADTDSSAQESGEGSLRSSVLGAALDNTSSMASARFEGTIEVTGGDTSETPGTFTIDFTGAYDETADASEVSMDMSDILTAAAESDPEAAASMELFGSLLEDPIQVITIGETSWVKWGLLSLFGVEDKWLEAPADDSDDLTSEMGFGGDSPTELLESLADADAELEELGREDIRGTETTHYRAKLDLESLAATMSPEERAEFEAEIGTSPDGEYVIDLWIDDEELLHRFDLDITGIDPTVEDGLESMRVTYDIWDHGVDLGITPPPADEVVTEAELGFSLDDFGDISG